jgi:Pol polyprotein, beta-barrel domain
VGTRYGVMMRDIYRKRGGWRKAEQVPKPKLGNRTWGMGLNIRPQQLTPTTDNTARFANVPHKDIIIMARITKVIEQDNIVLSTNTSALSAIHDTTHVWLVDSATSSHLSGNIKIFDKIHPINAIAIETASRDSFKADQRGTIRITIRNDTYMRLPPLELTLHNVIFVPKLNPNLLSVGRMTTANVNVVFSRSDTSLLINGEFIAKGTKINNLFAYMAQPSPESASYLSEPNELTLWHHRLAHAASSTLEKMGSLEMAIGFPRISAKQEMS